MLRIGISAIVLAVVAGSLVSAPAMAMGGQGAYLGYVQQQHAILDGTARAGGLWLTSARPVLASRAPAASRTTLANLSVETLSEAGCGTRDRRRLVLCLDMGYRLTPADQFALLEFAAEPFIARAGSEAALRAARRTLIRRPDLLLQSELLIEPDASCSGACERRIVAERPTLPASPWPQVAAAHPLPLPTPAVSAPVEPAPSPILAQTPAAAQVDVSLATRPAPIPKRRANKRGAQRKSTPAVDCKHQETK